MLVAFNLFKFENPAIYLHFKHDWGTGCQRI